MIEVTVSVYIARDPGEVSSSLREMGQSSVEKDYAALERRLEG